MRKRVIAHIDDSKIARILFANIFKDDDFADVLSFDSYVKFNEYLDLSPDVDCFVIDYNLKNAGGGEVISRIRSLRKYSGIPIVVYTATATDEIAYKSRQAGANQTVSKIVIAKELKDIVKKQIESPYVIDVERSFYEIGVLSWNSSGLFCAYFPDFDLKISAGSKEELNALIVEKGKELIREYKDEFREITSVAFNNIRVSVKDI